MIQTTVYMQGKCSCAIVHGRQPERVHLDTWRSPDLSKNCTASKFEILNTNTHLPRSCCSTYQLAPSAAEPAESIGNQAQHSWDLQLAVTRMICGSSESHERLIVDPTCV